MDPLKKIIDKWKDYTIKLNWIAPRPHNLYKDNIKITITDKSDRTTEIILDSPENVQIDLFLDNYMTELHQKMRNEKLDNILDRN
jgi:hypothetical protein